NGDVHDIGMNQLDILHSNHGYKVYNLGIKQPVDAMIAEFQKRDADAIGMSGLLVKSTVIMKEDLVTLNERGLAPPVILGGAALNRRYVEHDLRAIYKGQLFYGANAHRFRHERGVQVPQRDHAVRYAVAVQEGRGEAGRARTADRGGGPAGVRAAQGVLPRREHPPAGRDLRLLPRRERRHAPHGL